MVHQIDPTAIGERVGARFREIYVIDPDTGRAAAQIVVFEEPDGWVVAELALESLDPDETMTLTTTHPATHTGSFAVGDNTRDRFAYVGGEASQHDRFADALQEWTQRVRRWADTVDRRGGPLGAVSAAHLRSEADRVQARLSRAALGDAVRQFPEDRMSRSELADRLGVTRPFLYRVLAGREWSL